MTETGHFPPNFAAFHVGEEELRKRSIECCEKDAALTAHLAMVERSMDLLHNLLWPFDPDDHDRKCLSMLVIRLFNDLAATIKLTLAGYYQVAATQIRDILETSFLLDYFGTDRTLIHQWASGSKKERQKKFSPMKVRIALDERDGTDERKRASVYEEFCRLATHPTPDSARMIMPTTGETHMNVGPFFDATGLQHVLYEAALCGLQAAIFARRLMQARTFDQLDSAVSFHQQMQQWFSRFHDIEPDEHIIRELQKLLKEQEVKTADQ